MTAFSIILIHSQNHCTIFSYTFIYIITDQRNGPCHTLLYQLGEHSCFFYRIIHRWWRIFENIYAALSKALPLRLWKEDTTKVLQQIRVLKTIGNNTGNSLCFILWCFLSTRFWYHKVLPQFFLLKLTIPFINSIYGNLFLITLPEH